MSQKLVIVESPAKAKTLGKILGKSYSLKASLGHVRDLPRGQMGVDIENGFFRNRITVIRITITIMSIINIHQYKIKNDFSS